MAVHIQTTGAVPNINSTAKMSASWSLSQTQRDDTIARVSANIFTMGFIKGLPISDESANAAAVSFESKAYTAALVAARTTTGNRPLSETTNTYARWVQWKFAAYEQRVTFSMLQETVRAGLGND